MLLAMLAVTAMGEAIAWQISRMFDVRFEWVAAAALSVGATAVVASMIYDGRD